MVEKDKTKDQFGTYSENVGEWTTGTGGGAGTGKTHLRPVKKNDADNDVEEAVNNQSSDKDGGAPNTAGENAA